jgi:hypothetical protein
MEMNGMKVNHAKVRNIIAAASIALCASCATSTMRPYYVPLSVKEPLSGNIAVVGCQMKRLAEGKNASIFGPPPSFMMEWKNGDALLAALGERLSPESKRRLPFAPLPDRIFSAYREMKNAENPASGEATVAATGFIPIYDEKGKADRLDSKLLRILNGSLSCDYYVVFDGDIIDIVTPTLFNFQDFTLEYEISLIAYDRTGRKVLSRHYDRRYERISGYSWFSQATYFSLLEETMEHIQAALNTDIQNSFGPSDDVPAVTKSAI